MVNLYCTLIIKHRKDIDDVPESIRQKVIDELYKRGYDEHGNPLPEPEPEPEPEPNQEETTEDDKPEGWITPEE